jgi:deoxyribodipyrimidine photolyase-related protein
LPTIRVTKVGTKASRKKEPPFLLIEKKRERPRPMHVALRPPRKPSLPATKIALGAVIVLSGAGFYPDPPNSGKSGHNHVTFGSSTLGAVEGFVRQVLGWREFVRGVYWLDMPGLADANHYGHDRALPAWWWTGDTRMACLRDAIGQTMREGYAHHIQRLMLTGNFALLAGLAPREVAAWYLAVYVDAVEWVELPNVAGMALYANGGRFTTKPYVASGAYVKRMSNHCGGCAYAPEVRTGPRACPMTTLYWRFLDAHETELAGNPRTALMAKNLARLGAEERAAIRDWGERLLADMDGL